MIHASPSQFRPIQMRPFFMTVFRSALPIRSNFRFVYSFEYISFLFTIPTDANALRFMAIHSSSPPIRMFPCVSWTSDYVDFPPMVPSSYKFI